MTVKQSGVFAGIYWDPALRGPPDIFSEMERSYYEYEANNCAGGGTWDLFFNESSRMQG